LALVLAPGWPEAGRRDIREALARRATAVNRLTIRGRRHGDEDRHGTIIEVHGTDGVPGALT
jgi:hypothetical protein